MTRGKHGAIASQKRAEAASEKVAELQRELNAERESRRAEVAELKAEVQRLSGRLLRDVKRLADERVALAVDQGEIKAKAVADEWRERMRTVVRAGLTAGDELWQDPETVAEASGLTTAEVIAVDPLAKGLNRGVRRQFVNRHNRNRASNALAEAASQGDWQMRSV